MVYNGLIWVNSHGRFYMGKIFIIHLLYSFLHSLPLICQPVNRLVSSASIASNVPVSIKYSNPSFLIICPPKNFSCLPLVASKTFFVTPILLETSSLQHFNKEIFRSFSQTLQREEVVFQTKGNPVPWKKDAALTRNNRIFRLSEERQRL